MTIEITKKRFVPTIEGIRELSEEDEQSVF